MSEHLRALAVILVLATLVFTFSKGPAIAMATVSGEFERRRNLWFSITLAAFLAHNFWLFMLMAGVFLYRAASKDKEPVGLVMFVLIAVPLIGMEIPGFAGIRYLFKLDYFLLISLVVFVPIFAREMKKNSLQYFTTEKADRFFYAYLGLTIVLQFLASNGDDVTGLLRNCFVTFVGLFIPYAVTSRMVRNDVSLRTAVSGYIIGTSVMAAVGVFEASRSWLLYTSLESAFDLPWRMSIYLRRGDSLRAIATGGQAIPYGYMMAVGFILLLGLKRFFSKKSVWWAGLTLLVLGMLASYSRGPWLGAMAGFLVFSLTGPERWSNLGRLLLVAIVGGAILMSTPLGDKLYSSAVTVDEGSYDYRVKVLEVSSRVILKNPFFGAGDSDSVSELEELRQGQHIIDIVNSYVAVALRSGFVGLFLFLGIFASAIAGISKRMRAISDKGCESFDLGRSLLATLACILVSIYTVSSISYVPIIYYLMVALSVAYARFDAESSEVTLTPSKSLQAKRKGKLKQHRYKNSNRFN